jgi:hypothetical protein
MLEGKGWSLESRKLLGLLGSTAIDWNYPSLLLG